MMIEVVELNIDVRTLEDGSRAITVSNDAVSITVELRVPEAGMDPDVYASMATPVICGLPQVVNWVFEEDKRRQAEMN